MTDPSTKEPERFQLKAAKNRNIDFDGLPVTELPEWGGVANAPGVRFILHPPLDFEIAYKIEEYLLFTPFVRAKFDLSINDSPVRRKTYAVGSGCVIPPGTLIRTRLVEPVEFLCIIVDAQRAETAFQNVARGRTWVPELIETFADSGFASLTKEVRRSLLGDPLVEPAYLGALADGIFARIGCHYMGLNLNPPSASETLAPYLLNRIIEIVEDNIGETLSVKDLAKDSGLSRFHFSRAFQASTGQSPQDFIIARRLCRARDLLSATNDPIAKIAAATGFSSQAHFSSTFKKHIGTTPGKYRKAFQKV